jgi:hypothetical protein
MINMLIHDRMLQEKRHSNSSRSFPARNQRILAVSQTRMLRSSARRNQRLQPTLRNPSPSPLSALLTLRGWISITSNSTLDLPIVNPNQLSHPADREIAMQAFKRARSFFATNAMASVVIKETMPGATFTSDEDMPQYIMKSSYQDLHASCTCRMGNQDDPMAVVDSQARVIGLKGSMVVDASSFALLPPGHPQSTVRMFLQGKRRLCGNTPLN